MKKLREFGSDSGFRTRETECSATVKNGGHYIHFIIKISYLKLVVIVSVLSQVFSIVFRPSALIESDTAASHLVPSDTDTGIRCSSLDCCFSN